MLIVKYNKTGAICEVRPWVEGDEEKTGVAFGDFGYKFVCSCISCPEKPDIDWARDLVTEILSLYCRYHFEINCHYDPYPPYERERQVAKLLRLQKHSDGKAMFDVVQKIPPMPRRKHRPGVIY